MSEYNIEAEQAVLGSMLIDARCIGAVLTELHSDDFSDFNRPLIDSISGMFRENLRIDAVTVIAEAVKRGKDRKELREYVLQIVDITPTSANVMEYVSLVREATRVRKMHEIAEMMMRAKSSDSIAKAMEHMAAVMAGTADERIKTAEQMSEELWEWLDNPAPATFLPTTIEKLDEQLMIERSNYVVLGGFPSDGKTMLALQMALEWSKTMRVGLFYYEGTTLQAARRMFSAMGGISFTALKKRKLSQSDYDDVVTVTQAFNSLQFEAIQAIGFRAADIRAMATARKYDVVVIDYLQLIAPDNPRDDDTRRVSHASVQIKEMTIALNCVSLVLSQFHRLGNGIRRHPTMSDLRQSGQIEQDANIILLLSEAGIESWEAQEGGYNKQNIPQNTEGRLLQIAKNREGYRGGWMHMLMYGDLQRFVYYNPSAAPMPEPPPYQTGFADMGYGDFPGR